MAYTTLVAGTTITAAWANASVRDQSVSPFASAAARSSAVTSPVEGMVSHLNDVNTLGVYSGSAWSTLGPVHGALTTWTPTLTQLGSVTVTNTYSRYHRSGRLVTGWFHLTVTGSGTASNVILISTPFTAQQTSQPCGNGTVNDVSAGTEFVGMVAVSSSANSFDIRSGGNGSGLTDPRFGINAPSVALASGDVVRGSFSYEAAADA